MQPRRFLLSVVPALVLALLGCTPPPVGPDTAHTRPTPAPATPSVPEPPPTAESEATPPAEDPSGGYAKIGELYYMEVMVGGAKAEDEVPMIVAIHGLGDEPKNFAGLLADLPAPARIILPRAIDDYDVGWSWFPIRAADPDVTSLARGMALAARVLDSGITQLVATKPTKGKPIITGFSQGGMLTFTLATSYPDHYANAVAVGGWLPPPLWPPSVEDAAAYPPLVALHGDADPAVKIQPTRDAVAHLDKLGLDVELHEYAGVRHAIPPDMRAELHTLLTAAVKAAND